MSHAEQTTTLSIKPCVACKASLPEDSKFCRWCGARLFVDPDQTERLNSGAIVPTDCYRTTALATPNLYHPVSGPLMNALVANVPARGLQPSAAGLTKRMLLALMAVPIWVMIILLSPIDAYASAKIIGQRI